MLIAPRILVPLRLVELALDLGLRRGVADRLLGRRPLLDRCDRDDQQRDRDQGEDEHREHGATIVERAEPDSFVSTWTFTLAATPPG